MKKTKQILVLLMAVFPLGNSLQAWNGSGNAQSPYEITSAADLQQLATDVNNGTSYEGTFFELKAALDLSSVPNWTPIGKDDTHKFMATFDGGSKVIDHLTITASAANTGLFGYVENATIKNLGLTNANVSSTTGRYIGGICGFAKKTTFNNCYVEGTITGTDYSVAGISGNLDDAASVCTNCHFVGTITSTGNYNFGGLLGSTSATVTNCWASGSVSGKNKAGGLIGEAKGAVSDCYVTNSTVTGTAKCTGGLLGYSTNTVTQCYTNNVTVKGSDNETGGLIGEASGGNITKCYSANCTINAKGYAGGLIGMGKGTGSVSNCYAVNTITGTDQKVGGLIGDTSDAGTSFTISNCYAGGTVITTGSNVGGIVGKHGDGVAVDGLVAICSIVQGNDYVSRIIGSGNMTPNAYALDAMTVTKIGSHSPINGVDTTLIALKHQETYLRLNWNFTDVWAIAEGTSFPYFQWQGSPLPTALQNTQAKKVLVYATGNRQIVVEATGQVLSGTVSVFNIAGQKLTEQRLNGNKTVINAPLSSGIYLVKTGDAVAKVIVK